MSDIYLQITETPTVVTLSAPVVSGALASTVTVANTVTVALDSNSLSALENVTVTVGAAITGTVTVSNFPASQAVTFSAVTISNFPATQTIAGTVTANAGANVATAFYDGIAKWAMNQGGDGSLPIYVAISSGQTLGGLQDGDGTTFGIDRNFPVDIISALPAGTNRIGVVTIGGGTVTIGAGTAQIGSVTASISGTVPVSISSVTVGNSVTIGSLPALAAGTAQIGSVTASLAISSSVITSGSFSSLTSATLVPANTARKMATVYNLGAGQLFINAGATATTLGGGFMVALSSGDFYECDYTTTTLSAIFSTAGTASWMSH